jgi:hypothetical protein
MRAESRGTHGLNRLLGFHNWGGHLSLQDKAAPERRNPPRGAEPVATPRRSGVQDTADDRRPFGVEVATV